MRRMASVLGIIFYVGFHAPTFAAPAGSARLIGSIDFFGLREVRETAIREHLPLKEGDALMEKQQRPDGAAIAQAIGVAEVTLAYICCTQDQKVMVYVGV